MSLTAPSNLDEITPAWMTAALREHGHLSGDNEVALMERKLIGEESGFASRMARYTLSYQSSAPEAPTSLVIKIEPGTEAQQAVMTEFHLFEREIGVRATMTQKVALRTCHESQLTNLPYFC